MLFIEGDSISFIGVESRVCAGDNCAADGDLRSEPNDGGGDLGGGKGGDSGMDITRV